MNLKLRLPCLTRIYKNYTTLSVHVKPFSKSHNAILSTPSDQHPYWSIQLAAQPIDNQANTQLIHFLSQVLSIRKSDISLLSGHTSRFKKINVRTNLSLLEIEQRLIKHKTN
jgi:uncharacterized protein YggU (UPF0235/DUF167 family)